jgi:uncharacterized membrane protein
MRTRGLDRLTSFADAVVAIAMTLLVLPLVDIASPAAHTSLVSLLNEHASQLGAFALSFVVIARLWTVHHEIFERVVGYDKTVIRLTLIWLLSVVFLPFPTELIATSVSRGTSGLYIGTLLVSSLTLDATLAWIAGHHELRRAAADDEVVQQESSWVTPSLLALALVIAVLVPAVGMWSLLLLLLTGPASWWVRRTLRRRART